MTSSSYKLTAAEVLELLKNNTITVEEYVRSLLDRVEENDSTVKAWAHLDPDLVLSQARALDQIPEDQRGPLHGLAIGVKDIMDTKGTAPWLCVSSNTHGLRLLDMPTQYGSPIYKGNQPGSDSSAVGILRAAGALIFGS